MLYRTIQINYDLKRPGRDYQPVYDYIKSHGTWCHLLESMWLIRTTKSATQVRDELNRLVDANDMIATFDVSGDEWATSFSNSQTNWMHNNMGVPSYA
jgi:hypothetical protein